MLSSAQSDLIGRFFHQDRTPAFVLERSYEIVWLVNRFNVPFDKIIALNEGIRAFIIENPCLIESLVERVHATFDDIFALDEHMRAQLLTARGLEAVEQLVNGVHVPLRRIVALDEEKRLIVIMNANVIEVLVNVQCVSFEEIVALDEGRFNLVLQISDHLVKHDQYVPFDRLTQLSIDDLNGVLNDPVSQLATDMLYPPQFSCVLS